jgi:threonine dehydrogenase-like Zn-dependent dehydrogenase
LASGAATIQPGSWLTKEVTVVASVGAVHAEAIEAIELIADGHVDVNALHDRTVSLAELPHAMEVLADDPSSAVKVLVDPTG